MKAMLRWMISIHKQNAIFKIFFIHFLNIKNFQTLCVTYCKLNGGPHDFTMRPKEVLNRVINVCVSIVTMTTKWNLFLAYFTMFGCNAIFANFKTQLITHGFIQTIIIEYEVIFFFGMHFGSLTCLLLKLLIVQWKLVSNLFNLICLLLILNKLLWLLFVVHKPLVVHCFW